MPRTKNTLKTGPAARRSRVAAESKIAIAEHLRMLEAIAHDFWWTWHEQAASLFRSLDPVRWEATSHNPIAILRQTPREVLHVRVAEPPMRKAIESVHREMIRYRATKTWFDRHRRRKAPSLKVAYLCSEYAIHESMPQYSGGLGVLAGDHIKSASDLGIPFVAVGLLYQHGYYRQQLREDGSTRVLYPRQDPSLLPIEDTGVRFQCPIGTRMPHVRVWRQRVGRASLLLLDTDLPENALADRQLTEGLYKGEPQLRMEQQVLLGVGGMMALEALGERPTVVHLNEGHAAFAGVWMLASAVHRGESVEAAIASVKRSLVFTTHTPCLRDTIGMRSRWSRRR